jgi:hypothetical protein
MHSPCMRQHSALDPARIDHFRAHLLVGGAHQAWHTVAVLGTLHPLGCTAFEGCAADTYVAQACRGCTAATGRACGDDYRQGVNT